MNVKTNVNTSSNMLFVCPRYRLHAPFQGSAVCATLRPGLPHAGVITTTRTTLWHAQFELQLDVGECPRVAPRGRPLEHTHTHTHTHSRYVG